MDFVRVMAAAGGVCGVAALGLVLARAPGEAARGRARPEPAAAPADDTRPAPGADPAAAVAVQRLEGAVAALSARVESLERASRTRAGRLAGAGPGVAEGDESADDEGAGRVRLGTPLESDLPAGGAAALASPAMREQLKGVMREMQDEVFAERMKQRQTERETARAARIDKFVTEARLSASVEADLRAQFEQERDRARAVFEQVRAGEKTMFDAFGEMRKVREATNAFAHGTLDDSQRDLYDKMRQEDEASRRPPFFGGPPGVGGADGGSAPMPMPPPLPW